MMEMEGYVVGGSRSVLDRLDAVLEAMKERLFWSTRQLAKHLGWSDITLRLRLYYLLGADRVRAVETFEQIGETDGVLHSIYWYLPEREAEVIDWLRRSSRILRWRRLK